MSQRVQNEKGRRAHVSDLVTGKYRPVTVQCWGPNPTARPVVGGEEVETEGMVIPASGSLGQEDRLGRSGDWRGPRLGGDPWAVAGVEGGDGALSVSWAS